MSEKDSRHAELKEKLILRTDSTRETISNSGSLEPSRGTGNTKTGDIELVELSSGKQIEIADGTVNSVAAFQATLMEINPMKVRVPYESALLVKLLKTVDVGIYLAYSGAIPIITKYCFRTNSELLRKQMQIHDFTKIVTSSDEVFLLILKPSSFHIIILNTLEIVLNCDTPSTIKRSSISKDSKVIYIHTEDNCIYSYSLQKKKLKKTLDLGSYHLIELLREYVILYDNKTLTVHTLSSKQPTESKLVNFSLANCRVYANFENTLAVFIDQVSRYIYIKQLPSLKDLIDYRLEDKPLKIFFTKGDKTCIVLYANFKLGVFSVLSKEKPIMLDTLINIDKQYFHFNPITNMFFSNDILHDTYKWSFLEGNVEGLELRVHGGRFVKILENRLYELQGTYINIRDLNTLEIQNRVQIPTIQNFSILESSGEEALIIIYHSLSKFTLHDPKDLHLKYEVSVEKCAFSKVLRISQSNILICADRNNIRFFDLEMNQIIRNIFSAQIYDISEMALASKSQILISTSRDKTLKLWSIKDRNCSFIDKLIYQDSEFTCFIVDQEEEFLMAGTRNNLVVVWNLHNRHLTTTFQYADEILKVIVTPNNRFFMVGDTHGNIHIGNMKTFTKITQLYVGNSLNDFCFDYQEMFLYAFNRNSTKRYKNFFASDSFTIYGDVDDEWKYYTVLDDICVKGKVPVHDPNFDKLIFSPGGINSLHIYVYFGLAKHLKKCLKERIVIIPDRNGQTPIDMCLNLKDTELLGLFLDTLIREIPKNKYLARVFEDTIIKINYIGHPILDDLYRVFFRVCTDFGVPRFCDESVILPISVNASKIIINPDMFMEKEHYESKKNMISFKEALIPLSFNIGSDESIEFLKSIIECPNSEIFRTPLIREYLSGKWKVARKGMFLQMLLYILYMSSLLFHVFSEHYSLDLWMILSTDCTIMFFEFYQMYINGADYWDDIWNYLDVFRALLCKIYLIYLVLDFDKSKQQFLTLLLLISFWRGIAYYRLFKDTRFFINLIIEVMTDMRAFLIVLTYTTIAHIVLGCVIDRIYGRESDWTGNILGAYGMLFGDMDTPSDIIHWIVLTINLIIDPIIMLNLLISIIGATYARVENNNEIADMKEVAEMVLEIEMILKWRRNITGKYYLQMCMKKDMLDTEFGTTNDRIKSIDKKINTIVELLKMEKKEASRVKVQELTKNIFSKDTMMGFLGIGNNIETDKTTNRPVITPKPKLSQLKMQEGTDLDVFSGSIEDSILKLNAIEL